MGQQQLLLVILVTIIVGIATVVAINTFSSAAESQNVSAVQNDLASIASAAQGYYMKPSMMDGGGNTFDNMTWENIGGVPGSVNSNGNLENENGIYSFSSAPAGQSFVVEGAAAQADTSIYVYVEQDCMGMQGGSAPSSCN